MKISDIIGATEMSKIAIFLLVLALIFVVVLANFACLAIGVKSIEVYFEGKNGKKLESVTVEVGEETVATVEITSSLPGLTLGFWSIEGGTGTPNLVFLMPGQAYKAKFSFTPQDTGRYEVSYRLLSLGTNSDNAFLKVKSIKKTDKEKLWEELRDRIRDAILKQQQASEELDEILRDILSKQGLTPEQQESVLDSFKQLSLADKLVIAGASQEDLSQILKQGVTAKIRGKFRQNLESVYKIVLPYIFSPPSGSPIITMIKPYFKKGDPKSLLDKSKKWEEDTPYGVAGNKIYVIGRGFNRQCRVWLGTSPGQGQALETNYVAGLLIAKIPEEVPNGDYYVWVTRGGSKSNAVQIKIYGNAYILRLTGGLCIKESKWDQGTDSDEVYFIVVVMTGEYYWGVRSQVIGDVDSGEEYPIQLQFFGFEGKAFVPYDTVYIDIFAYESDGISEEVEELVDSSVKAAALATCFLAAAISGGVEAEACVLNSDAILGVAGVTADLINSILKLSDNDDYIKHKRIALTLEDLALKSTSAKPFIRFELDGGDAGKHALEISITGFSP